jgi:hypothetical protein
MQLPKVTTLIISLALLLFYSRDVYCQVDVENKVKQIKEVFAGINSSENLSTEKIDLLEYSSEGGELTFFFNHNSSIVKTVVWHYGETGKIVKEYYLHDGQLIFAFFMEFQYDKPIYEQSSEIVRIVENRYYFSEANLIRWINSDDQILQNRNSLFIEQEEVVIRSFRDYKKYFKF